MGAAPFSPVFGLRSPQDEDEPRCQRAQVLLGRWVGGSVGGSVGWGCASGWGWGWPWGWLG